MSPIFWISIGAFGTVGVMCLIFVILVVIDYRKDRSYNLRNRGK